MRHPNRIIRRLRHERNQLREQVIVNEKTYRHLLDKVCHYKQEDRASNVLSYVRNIEERNRNQSQQIMHLEQVASRYVTKCQKLEQDHDIDLIIIIGLVVLLILVAVFA